MNSFLGIVVNYAGPSSGFVASKRWLSYREASLWLWMQGTEKSTNVFRALCVDPVVTSHAEEGFTANFNYFTAKGGVERWSIWGQHSPQPKIEGARKEVLEKPGTFFYPIIP